MGLHDVEMLRTHFRAIIPQAIEFIGLLPKLKPPAPLTEEQYRDFEEVRTIARCGLAMVFLA
jgi:hypothetical protein